MVFNINKNNETNEFYFEIERHGKTKKALNIQKVQLMLPR